MEDKGESNGESQNNEISSSEIFAAEVASIQAAEAEGARKASDFIRVDEGSKENKRDEEDEHSEENNRDEEDEHSENGAENADSGDSEETQEGQESEESERNLDKQKRHDWKTEAIESKQALTDLKSELAEIKQALKQNTEQGSKDEPGVKDEPFEIPKVDIEKLDLSQELKDLLEYTPGLDTMVTTLAAETARAIIEKANQDRTREEQDRQSTQNREESDRKYWTDVNSWLQGQYPELSLSDIRNSPDFADWSNYHKSWVDAQLSSSNYDDPSGAQKVFERYIRDNELIKQKPEPNQNKRSLAAARSPKIQKKGSSSEDRRSLFQREAERLDTKQHNFRTTI